MGKSFITENDAEYGIFFKNICRYAARKTAAGAL
jgi:hypothetical protein